MLLEVSIIYEFKMPVLFKATYIQKTLLNVLKILDDHYTFQETGKQYQLFWVATVQGIDLDDHHHHIFEHRLIPMLVYLVLQSAAWDANYEWNLNQQ